MTVWLILLINCVQMGDAKKPPFPVSCSSTLVSRDFKTKKQCESGMIELLKRDALPLDAKCVSTKVFRE